jgi:hypothetical protein
VQINREADSRNATISLRGLPGTFARTTLNGVGFADPILSSATNTASTPLGAFNSDIFSAITVIKSPDASDLAGGLSGNIDLRIAPALSRKKGGYIKASYEYNDLGGLGSPQFSGGYNAHITDNFAVFGVVAYKVEKFRRDSISVNTWANRLGSIQVGNQALPGSNPVYDALIAAISRRCLLPQPDPPVRPLQQGPSADRHRRLEWQATDEIKVGVTGFYTERNLSQGTNHLLYVDTSAGNNPSTAANAALGATSAVAHFTSLGTPYVVNTRAGRAPISTSSRPRICRPMTRSGRSRPSRRPGRSRRPSSSRTISGGSSCRAPSRAPRCWPTRSSWTSSRTPIATWGRRG